MLKQQLKGKEEFYEYELIGFMKQNFNLNYDQAENLVKAAKGEKKKQKVTKDEFVQFFSSVTTPKPISQLSEAAPSGFQHLKISPQRLVKPIMLTSSEE